MTSVQFAQLGCGGFFTVGLLTGFWKYRAMVTSADGVAPVYVDICHRAALMYAFACLVLAEFARSSAWSDSINTVAVIVPMAFFASAVLIYGVHGVLRDTDNQMRRPHRLGKRHVHGRVLSAYIYLLISGELGGFIVLLSGFVQTLRTG
jgi:hypothetical protein